jgi:transcription initiation factor TFIIB
LSKRKNRQKIEYAKKCPECGSNNLIRDYQRGEVVCRECGLVVQEDLIDQGPEWRAFDSEQRQKRARTGASMKYTLYDKGLSTSIGWKNRDAYGRAIPTKNRSKIYRLRKWQRRTKVSNAGEQNLARAFAELSRISSQMSLPRVTRERAGVIYRKAAKKNLIRGRHLEVVVAAVVYTACRLSGAPRTLDELSNVSQSSRKEIGGAYRYIVQKLGLAMKPTSPIDYVSRFCSELKLSQDVRKKAIELLKRAIENELNSGRGPAGMAAAAIYMSSVLNECGKTQSEIADVAGVTEVTIRNRYKEIAENLNIDIINS